MKCDRFLHNSKRAQVYLGVFLGALFKSLLHFDLASSGWAPWGFWERCLRLCLFYDFFIKLIDFFLTFDLIVWRFAKNNAPSIFLFTHYGPVLTL